MLQVTVNLWAVLVATVVNMIIGGVWFSPGLFAKSWMKLHGLKKIGTGAWAFIIEFIFSFVMVFVFANILKFAQSTTVVDGILTAAIVWIGIVVPTMLATVLWQGKPVKLFFIESLPRLLMLIVASIILVLWL